MELGMIGLGKMGANMTERLLNGGHRVIVHDVASAAIDRMAAKGAVCAGSIESMAEQLQPPRCIWMMVPAGDAVDETLSQLMPFVTRNDVVIDGGNSHYRDTLRRASELRGKGIELVDIGTSGGIWGLREGYCLMIGGNEKTIDRLRSVFETLAPAADRGWERVGPSGAGHFVKMVHNGIEYGLMQAYAEGFAVLDSKGEFRFDLHQIAELWRHGSVVRSWLLDLATEALGENPALQGIRPYVNDSGEGRWAVAEAIDRGVSAPVTTLSLLERLRSREPDSFAGKLLAVMRNKFGGHDVRRE